MRICIVYDGLFPYSVGGAERWYRALALELASRGHQVTYLTRRQWPPDDRAELPGVRVLAVSPPAHNYDEGRRSILPTIRFGIGVFVHLMRHRHEYDAVHTSLFPYFHLLAIGVLFRGTSLVVDWLEVWPFRYWIKYLGVRGVFGWLVQQLCAWVPQHAVSYSTLHYRRVTLHGSGQVHLVRGLYCGAEPVAEPVPAKRVVVFAGRHIPEKGVRAVVPAVAVAMQEIPDLRCMVFGDGPERAAVLAQIRSAGLEGRVQAPGFVSDEMIRAEISSALCLLHPSSREGYGLVVLEAAATGTPAVLLDGPDNASVEFVSDGVNGFVVGSTAPTILASAIVRVYRGGNAFRVSTLNWFQEHHDQLSMKSSLRFLESLYSNGSTVT